MEKYHHFITDQRVEDLVDFSQERHKIIDIPELQQLPYHSRGLRDLGGCAHYHAGGLHLCDYGGDSLENYAKF